MYYNYDYSAIVYECVLGSSNIIWGIF